MTQVKELRIALTVDDFAAAVRCYERVLGRERAARWDQPAGQGGVFEVPRATLEILDREMAPGGDTVARVESPDGMQLTLVSGS